MPAFHHRIERSAFRRGEYVGYCHGAQRIREGGRGWQTYGLCSAFGTPVYLSARTLWDLGELLDEAAKTDPALL